MCIGTIRDYFVCYHVQASTHECLVPPKKFFWCSSTNFIFSALPAPSAAAAQKFASFPNYMFTGEFDQVLVQSSEPAKVIDAAAGIVLPPKHLTELDRLAYTVHSIDRSCSVVPKGCLKYTPTHEIVMNEAFRGQSVADACSLKNWQHVRPVEQQDKCD